MPPRKAWVPGSGLRSSELGLGSVPHQQCGLGQATHFSSLSVTICKPAARSVAEGERAEGQTTAETTAQPLSASV